MISASHLTKTFGRLQALDDFSATLERGRSVLLIGPNGSGKTTFIKCILGLVLPDKGTLTLDGQDLSRPDLRRHIGYMPQIGRFPDHLKAGQILDMMREIRRGTYHRLDEDLIEAFEIHRFAHKPARTLSGGMRQKLGACLAFLFDPDVLILDEPTAGLDPVAAEILKEKVLESRDRNKLILITSHILSDLDEITTDLMHLIDGRLQFHRPIGELMEEHGETRLSRIVVRIMKQTASTPATSQP
ncbi:MAG: ABC transporter ATP-binding protein [Luteolibacter sp.]